MAGVILNDQRRFPIGTSVSAYLRTNWTTAERAFGPVGPPKGAAAAGPVVVAADGSIDFSALAAGKYYAYAQVGSEDRYTRFEAKTAADSPGGDAAVSGQQLADEVARALAAETNLQPKDSDLTAIAALATTAAGRSLLAAVDAAAIRSIAGSEAQDSDLDAIAALTTTSFGRSLLAAADASGERTLLGLGAVSLLSSVGPADVSTAFRNAFGRGQRQAGTMAPGFGGSFSAVAIGANLAYAGRFVPSRDMTITQLSFALGTAAGANDNCDVGLYDSALNLLGSAGSTAGKLNAGANSAKTLALTAPVNLTAGEIYYAAFAVGALGGSAATVGFLSLGVGGVLFGSGAGVIETLFKAASFPLPASLAGFSVGGSSPVIAVRE